MTQEEKEKLKEDLMKISDYNLVDERDRIIWSIYKLDESLQANGNFNENFYNVEVADDMVDLFIETTNYRFSKLELEAIRLYFKLAMLFSLEKFKKQIN